MVCSDFAGETIVSILNFADTAYKNLADTKDGRVSLRELTVNGALAALKSPLRCKVLIICCPVLSEYGGEDVVDLFDRIGCDAQVVYSSDTTRSLSEACFPKMREMNMFTHNISYPSARLLMAIVDSLILRCPSCRSLTVLSRPLSRHRRGLGSKHLLFLCRTRSALVRKI